MRRCGDCGRFGVDCVRGADSRVRCEISSRRSETPSHRIDVRCGASPNQKGTEGGAPCASSTSTRPGGLHTLHAPACVAQQDHVAGPGVDREVFVQCGDLYVFRLQDHAVERGVRNGARRSRSQCCALRAADEAGRGRRRAARTRRSGRGRTRCRAPAARSTSSKRSRVSVR